MVVDGRLTTGPTPQVSPPFDLEKRRLAHEGHDDPGDEVPVLVQRERHYRLNVEDEPGLLLGADSLLPVELERDAHQVRDRVRQLLLQIGVLLRRCLLPAGWRCE